MFDFDSDTFLCKWALVILLVPLAGFVVQVFLGKKLPRQGDWLPTLCMFIPLCIASWMMVLLLHGPEGIQAQSWTVISAWLSTSESGGLLASIDFGIYVDNLTVIMLFVVTLVSFLVHLYSWGYMHGEVRYNHFFAYLGLFSFSMLGLCVASNLLFLFIFWELVGVCSYFLIGFYFEKKSAQDAAIKAFMTTRLGDVGMFLAILIIAVVAGSLEFDEVFRSVERGAWKGQFFLGIPLLTLTGIALFCGPVGKSAQFPLHIWLPDAMEGPTPVSALIHAATMVAAGVYLVGRMFPFLAGPEYFAGNFFVSDPLFVVALVGAITAFIAASIAFAQTDIKKVLAYSTISQLGYMMLGLGVGSVAMGLFHLFTHAFFKALLFLGSGSVIHAVHSNELADMGGLRRKLPITWATFAIGTLAIAGLPFLSGFYSKEGILANALSYAKFWNEEEFAAFRSGEPAAAIAYLPFVLGVVTAGMTAFYMFRLLFLTFHGAPRNQEAYGHAHESPATMTVPLVVLAVLSVISGGLPFADLNHWFEHRVSSELLVPVAAGEGAAAAFRSVEHLTHEPEVHTTVLGLSVGVFTAGLVLAALFFTRWGPFCGRQTIRAGTALWPIYVFLKNLWFFDALFTWLALRLIHLFHVVVGWFDRVVIDGVVNFQRSLCQFFTGAVGTVDYWGVDGGVRGLGESTLRAGRSLRRVQTGLLQEYVYASLYLAFGVVVLLLGRLMWGE
jgi:NADH-quinone oxidoreductase subunit L